jgi:hypothetical protein
MLVEINAPDEDSDRKAEPTTGFRARRLSRLSEIERIRSKLGSLYTDKDDPATLDPFREVEYLPKRRLRVLQEAFKEGI